MVHKKSVRAILAARPAFRGLRIARLVGRANSAEASRKYVLIFFWAGSRIPGRMNLHIHKGIYCLLHSLTNLKKVAKFPKAKDERQ